MYVSMMWYVKVMLIFVVLICFVWDFDDYWFVGFVDWLQGEVIQCIVVIGEGCGLELQCVFVCVDFYIVCCIQCG